MKILKYISLILIPLILVSCSGLQSSWKNFRAHYNSYYNADKSFKAGLKKIDDQPVEINPEQPIRVHLHPPQVAAADFENTIDKGARILRKFPDSKWTDDALFLIGKSYYYKGDYYLAIEKFEELEELTEQSDFIQRAAIWKARSLLDLEQYEEGVSYITEIFNAGYWTPSLKAELRVLLAEFYTMQENWEQAANHLGDALVDIDDGDRKARTFFLFGQVLERLERYGEAFFAYDNVASLFPDYEYVFWSNLKKAEVARKEGNLDPALSIFTSMSKDDKNFSRLDRINYEIARTLEMRGNMQRAEQAYNEILRSDYSPASRNVEAKTYYRLGKIYSDHYNNFGTAAAYFDSASARVTNINFLESNFNAQNLASAYGSYDSLKGRINRLDSLLWLGSLQPAQLDSAIEALRNQRLATVDSRRNEQQDGANRLLNIPAVDQPQAQGANASEYGFLNYRNSRLKQESMNRFAAMWQNRPLVDNWRRIEVIRSTGIATGAGENISSPSTGEAAPARTDTELGIDLSEIPTTEEEKNAYTSEMLNAKYELGNLFFLTLNMPDSATTYFTQIVREHPGSPLVPRSMYSLFEIYTDNENTERALYWGNKIIDQYGGSRYAEKVAARLNGDPVKSSEVDSTISLLSEVQNIERSTGAPSPAQAERFRNLAIAHRSTEQAPFIYYRAIEAYVELAKNETDSELYREFLQAQTAAQPDSSTKVTSPFYSAYWDSVRSVITEYDSIFADHPHEGRLKALKEVLDASAETLPPPAEPLTAAPKPVEKEVPACNELNSNIEVVGGRANFLAMVNYPSNIDREKLSGDITYEILIKRNGSVASQQLVSSDADPVIEDAFSEAIENNLFFDPVSIDGEIQEVSCRISFPVNKEIPKPVSPKRLKACKEISADLEVVGGMDNFLSMVTYPTELSKTELPENIIYQISIEESGKVGSYRLVSADTPPPLDEAFGKAIGTRLFFDPISMNGRAQKVSCEMTFPIQR